MARSLEVLKLFQSAPGLEAGRSGSRCHVTSYALLFQSAPGLEAGRSNKLDNQ